MVTLLIGHSGIAINQGNNDGTTPLFIACQEGHHETVAVLLKDARILVNKADVGATPLFMACQGGQYPLP